MARSQLDDIVEQIRTRACADFAFVLTRRGRLITIDAPREMPDSGRQRLVKAAKAIVGTSQTLQVTLSREDLVPFGGAAPVDVYLAVAREQAILCVVMSTWSDKRPIIPALIEGIGLLEPFLDRKPGNAPKREASEPPPPVARPSARPGALKPRRRGAMTGLVGLMGGIATPSRTLEKPPVIQSLPTPVPKAMPKDSLPDISVGEAPLGRESLDAIRREFAGSLPEISLDESPLGRESLAAIQREVDGSMPDISVGEASLGRASLEAIEVASRRPATSAPEVRAELASLSRASAAELARIEADLAISERKRPDPGSEIADRRATNPWAEPATDSKRNAEAQRSARGAQPPRVTLKLESLDEETVEAALLDEIEGGAPSLLDEIERSGDIGPDEPTLVQRRPPVPEPPSPPRPRPRTEPPPLPSRVPQSSYEAWSDAVDEVTQTEPPSKRKRR